ncbi:hypothetical protein PSCLAVI8L_230016 [Pseudoclavibacter sp. 8L]|nr:hypothetical protein PSCLAVI8L_230016 [Pseudoclavibacter sp. 8L]
MVLRGTALLRRTVTLRGILALRGAATAGGVAAHRMVALLRRTTSGGLSSRVAAGGAPTLPCPRMWWSA